MSLEPESESQDALPPLRSAVFGQEQADGVIQFPNGKRCLASDMDFSWQHFKLLAHLEFLQRLNEQQRFNIPPDKLIEMASNYCK